MKFDMHTHNQRCGHAFGQIEDYIQTGIEKGLDVIGISDHCPNFSVEDDQPTPRLKMSKSEFSSYVKEVLELKEKYKDKIEVLLGIESDFIPGKTDLYAQQYDNYPFDYIIGSVHGIDGHSIFAKSEWERMSKKELEQIKTLYCYYVQQSAKSRSYQVLGHIDAIKTHISDYHKLVPEAVDEMLQVISKEQLVVEVNTSGDKKGLTEWFPSLDLLERCYHYKIDLTFGSDAHRPEHLAGDWEKVCQTLNVIGYSDLVIFRNKKPVRIPLKYD